MLKEKHKENEPDFFLKQVKHNQLVILLSIMLLLVTIFLVIYGYRGMDAINFLIFKREISLYELFRVTKVFLLTTILFSFFSSFLCVCWFFTCRKILDKVMK